MWEYWHTKRTIFYKKQESDIYDIFNLKSVTMRTGKEYYPSVKHISRVLETKYLHWFTKYQ